MKEGSRKPGKDNKMRSIFSSHILTADQPGSKRWPVFPFSCASLTEKLSGPPPTYSNSFSPPPPVPEQNQANTTPPSRPFPNLLNRPPQSTTLGAALPPTRLQFPRSYRSATPQAEFLWQPWRDPIFSGYISNLGSCSRQPSLRWFKRPGYPVRPLPN